MAERKPITGYGKRTMIPSHENYRIRQLKKDIAISDLILRKMAKEAKRKKAIEEFRKSA
jgi:hypothetical protein